MHVLFIPSWFNSVENPDDNNFISNQIHGVQNLGIKVGVLFLQNTLHQFISGRIIPIKTKAAPYGSYNEVRTIAPLIPIKYRLGQWGFEKLAYRLYKIYERRFGRPEVLHAHGYLGAIMANYISQKTSVKFIITEHANDILMNSLLPSLRRKVIISYENSSKLISVGHLLKSGMSKLTGKEIKVIPNCINTDLFYPPINKEPGEKVIILISSYLFKHKQVELALRAMKILKDKGIENIELKIVGDGPDMNRLKNLSQKLELKEVVNFKGLVLNRYLPEVMREADILLVTCQTETFCVALIEGLACGMKAVIPLKGEPALYTKKFEVSIVKEHTPESYAHEIAQLIGSTFHPDKLKQFELVKATYSIERVCQKLYNTYKSVL